MKNLEPLQNRYMTKQLIDITKKKKAQGIASPARRLITLKEAATYLGRGEDSLRELLYAREMRCVQRGKGKIWLDINELDQWVEHNLQYM